MIETIGILGSILIVVSMFFKTNTYKGTFCLRLLNAIGSFIFVIYGILLPAWSVAVLNCVVMLTNIVYIIRIKMEDYK